MVEQEKVVNKVELGINHVEKTNDVRTDTSMSGKNIYYGIKKDPMVVVNMTPVVELNNLFPLPVTPTKIDINGIRKGTKGMDENNVQYENENTNADENGNEDEDENEKKRFLEELKLEEESNVVNEEVLQPRIKPVPSCNSFASLGFVASYAEPIEMGKQKLTKPILQAKNNNVIKNKIIPRYIGIMYAS